MNIHVFEDAQRLGESAAREAGRIIRECVKRKGKARIVLSTGASQFEFFHYFVKETIDWPNVEMFHLDEYVGISDEHPASFRKYLRERFTEIVPIGAVHWVGGEGSVAEQIKRLNDAILQEPIDLALIGIGENAHIAFNDPPADFQVEDAYISVRLDDDCKRQQVREGWFGSLAEVPVEAICMSVKQIMRSRHILSVVPRQVKADAIRDTMRREVAPDVPATILKTHGSWSLYLDKESASGLSEEELR